MCLTFHFSSIRPKNLGGISWFQAFQVQSLGFSKTVNTVIHQIL